MSKKETIAVAALFGLTTILKICSVVALYSYKMNDFTYQKAYLAHNNIENDLLCPEHNINAEPQDDLKFEHTVMAHR